MPKTCKLCGKRTDPEGDGVLCLRCVKRQVRFEKCINFPRCPSYKGKRREFLNYGECNYTVKKDGGIKKHRYCLGCFVSHVGGSDIRKEQEIRRLEDALLKEKIHSQQLEKCINEVKQRVFLSILASQPTLMESSIQQLIDSNKK